MIVDINTFNDIEITKDKSLVICDIDDTLLYYPTLDYMPLCIDMIKELYPYLTENDAKYKKELEGLINMYKYINSPKHTDFDGFMNMSEKIKNTNGELIFLTARNETSTKLTIKQFNDIGLNYDNYKVHYTNNKISKGEYIKNNIDITQYNDVIFIDDYYSYIESVINEFNFIKCYKFTVK